MTSDRDYVFRPFRTVWFSMALTDASAVLVALANAAMFLDQRQRAHTYRYETSAECLTYYGQCVQQVTRRLGDVRENLSEGVITAILGLICHDVGVPLLQRDRPMLTEWTAVCGHARSLEHAYPWSRSHLRTKRWIQRSRCQRDIVCWMVLSSCTLRTRTWADLVGLML